MGTVNVANPKLDLTVRIFDEFYGFQYDVQAQEYDVVYSYFKSIYTTALAAGNFTVALFRVSAEQNIPVLNLLTQLQGSTGAEVTMLMAYYLNNNRSNATLLGVSTPTQANFYAARNVRT